MFPIQFTQQTTTSVSIALQPSRKFDGFQVMMQFKSHPSKMTFDLFPFLSCALPWSRPKLLFYFNSALLMQIFSLAPTEQKIFSFASARCNSSDPPRRIFSCAESLRQHQTACLNNKFDFITVLLGDSAGKVEN